MLSNSHEESMEYQNQDESDKTPRVLLTLKFKWLNQKKKKADLQKALQTWFSKCITKTDCSVEEISSDDHVVIKVEPPPGLTELDKLTGKTLLTKEKEPLVTIQFVILGKAKLEPQASDGASANQTHLGASANTNTADLETAVHKMQVDEQKNRVSTEGDTGENKMTAENCVLSLNQYLYVSHIYKEELSRILDENKVEMKEEVHVNFEPKSQVGKPTEASTKFIDIVQKSFPDCYGSVFSVKSVHPDLLNRALNAIMKNDKKLLATMSSNEITVFGPSCNQNDLASMLNTTHKTDTALKESEWPSSPQNFNDDVCLKISMTIKDDLTEAGLTIDKSQWKKLMTSSVDQLEKIQAKYNVDFNESSISEGKVKIKASYKGYRGNPAMESHAVRALLHLYQKMMTSSQHLPPPYSATRGSEGASSEAGLNDDSKQNGEESATGGATGDTKDDKCSICLSEFTDKKQLKCKHEFCSECLRNAVKHCGHICPICKDVFGEMNGNQPDGKMTWDTVSYSLPGFPNFGHIRITYNIPSGKQMKHHPNPGKHYVATCRTAYLPDNKEGNEVLQLLKKAFDQKLIFTVGASRTTGADNMVTWNDIHHKTSMTGGPEGFGYPDPTYLSRVKEELKAKGIK